MPKTFGDNLRHIRRELGWTQERLMAALGRKHRRQGQISKWETSMVLPDPETVVELARATGYPTSDFLDDVELPWDRLRANQGLIVEPDIPSLHKRKGHPRPRRVPLDRRSVRGKRPRRS